MDAGGRGLSGEHLAHRGDTYRAVSEGSLALIKGEALDMFVCLFIYLFIYVFGSLLRPYPQHMEVPRLGVDLKLQLPAYATATAPRDPNLVCDLHHSSWQRWIPDPPSEARDRTCILMDTSRGRFHCTTTGTPIMGIIFK